MNVKLVIAEVVLVCFLVSAHAQDGAYDSSFGDLGKDWIDVSPGTYEAASTMIALPGAGFFMGGECRPTSTYIACAAWLTPTGNLVAGYGPTHNGTAVFNAFTGWPSDGFLVNSAAALPDGRVVAATLRKQGGTYMALLRADGSGLDPSVGNGAGYVIPTFQIAAIRVTPQQKIVAAGNTTTSPSSVVVARYSSDFKLDTTFGSGGSMTLGFPDGDASVSGMTLQRDGKIVVTGQVSVNAGGNLAIARFTIDGQPDSTFGVNSDGRFENNFGYAFASGSDITEDKKGRLVFAGNVSPPNNGAFPGQWLIARVLGGGAIDPAFNAGQPQIFTIIGSSAAYDPHACCIAMQSDNRIVAAGTMRRNSTDSGMYYALTRFNDDGSFDDGFGGGGQSYGDLSDQGNFVANDMPQAMVIVPGGIVIAGGTTLTSGENRFSAAKEKIDLLFADDFE